MISPRKLLLKVASRLSRKDSRRKDLILIARGLTRIARGDPAQIEVTSPAETPAPKDPATTLRDQGDTILTVMKLLDEDKHLDEGVNKLNKRAVGLQKDFQELGKLLVTRLTKKDDKEGTDELLKQSKLKLVTDVLDQLGKELKPYVDTAKFLKDLHEQTQRDKKTKPKDHKKPSKKVKVEPKGSENDK